MEMDIGLGSSYSPPTPTPSNGSIPDRAAEEVAAPAASPPASPPQGQRDGEGTSQPQQEFAPQSQDDKTTLSGGSQRLKTREVFFEALKCPIPDFRLQQITKEIVAISNRQRGLIDSAISASFLMRALLEWSLLHHCAKSRKNEQMATRLRKPPGFEPSLNDLLIFFSDLGDPVIMPKRLGEKCQHIRERWLIDLNCNTHNAFGNHTAQRLIDIAADVRPIVRFIFGGDDDSDDS